MLYILKCVSSAGSPVPYPAGSDAGCGTELSKCLSFDAICQPTLCAPSYNGTVLYCSLSLRYDVSVSLWRPAKEDIRKYSCERIQMLVTVFKTTLVVYTCIYPFFDLFTSSWSCGSRSQRAFFPRLFPLLTISSVEVCLWGPSPRC